MSDGTITLVRDPGGFMGRVRKFGVGIDGWAVGQISRGETKRFGIEPGRHELRVSLDWVKSRPLVVDVPPGGDVRVRCRWEFWRTFVRPGVELLDGAGAQSAQADAPAAAGGEELPPAGWYADPMAGGGLRYWDGSAWTETTEPGTPSGVSP